MTTTTTQRTTMSTTMATAGRRTKLTMTMATAHQTTTSTTMATAQRIMTLTTIETAQRTVAIVWTRAAAARQKVTQGGGTGQQAMRQPASKQDTNRRRGASGQEAERERLCRVSCVAFWLHKLLVKSEIIE